MYYVYVLKSYIDKKFYVGYTSNLKLRISQHNKGESKSTKFRKPLALVYYEAFKYKEDAINQELFYKTGQGRRVLKSRLKTITEQDKHTRDDRVANCTSL